MRALKTILIIVFALAVILLILGYTGPETSVAKRSVHIEAHPETVYPWVASLRNQHEWGVWKDMDEGQKNEWTGADASVGSMQTWQGEKVGRGSQRIIAMADNRSVSTELKFLEPFESTIDVDLALTPENNGTRVDWIMKQENTGLKKLMAVFMNIDKMVGPDLEKGLLNLKEKAEADQFAMDEELRAKSHGGYVIETIERPQITYVGKRANKLKWTDMKQFFGKHYPAAYGAIGKQGLQPAGQPCAVYFEWNEKDQTTDVMAAIPVQAGEEASVKGFETYTVPSSKMLHIQYYGDYEQLGKAHEAMHQMIASNNLVHYDNVIEEYITDPTQEPDTSKWLTNIYYMVR
jgi:effector-binding domain-containing protein